jgi:hypothetical protein
MRVINMREKCVKTDTSQIQSSNTDNLVPRSFLLGRKDPGRRWSSDLLKSSRFLISNPRRGR